MKICYIVLTCEKYFENRVQWQLETMFQSVDKNDIYFLGHTMDLDRRLYSWGAPDDYNNLPYKFLDFFKHLDIDYDWYMLIDDDTYVFHERLVSLLEGHSAHDTCSLGKVLDHIKHSTWGLYLSGGAGTVLSRTLYTKIKDLIRSKESVKEVVPHWCADICLGVWIRSIPGSSMFDYSDFHTGVYNAQHDSLESVITFHKLTKKSDYTSYKLMEESNPTEKIVYKPSSIIPSSSNSGHTI